MEQVHGDDSESVKTNNGESAKEESEMTPEQARAFVEGYKKFKREAGIAQAESQAEEIATINQQFIAFVKNKHGGRFSEVSQKEFEIWEGELASSWAMLNKGMIEGGIRHFPDKEASAQRAMFFTTSEATLHETIEAQAGRFYRERAAALQAAIESSGASDEVKQRQMELLSAFYSHVHRHIELKYIGPQEIRDEFLSWKEYDDTRTNVHNNVIDELNGLNDLARQYGLKPFTPRNFWDSRVTSQTPDMQKRIRYDRDVVEEYYSIAFSDKVATERRKFQRKMDQRNMY